MVKPQNFFDPTKWRTELSEHSPVDRTDGLLVRRNPRRHHTGVGAIVARSAGSWEDTLRREVFEEACARVTDARLPGYFCSLGLNGHDQSLVLTSGLRFSTTVSADGEARLADAYALECLQIAGVHKRLHQSRCSGRAYADQLICA